MNTMPEYLDVPPERLGQGTPVTVRVLGDMASIARDMAQAMLDSIREAASGGRPATLIVPVGPVDQFPILAERVNQQRVDLRDVCLINMDEYLTDDDRPIDPSHPLSFRGFMNRLFYDRLDPSLAPRMEHRVFPDPQNPRAIQQLIDERGGVDACFGGIRSEEHTSELQSPCKLVCR